MTGFLDLAWETRLEIYKLHFKSLILKCVDTPNTTRKTPKPPKLALQRTCRQVNAEVKGIWISLVHFEFESSRSMLDRLSSISYHKLNLVRNVMTPADDALFVSSADNGSQRTSPVTISDVVHLLPGLKLDVLTIDFRNVTGHPSSTYKYVAYSAWRQLEFLILRAQGWRELHFVASRRMTEAWAAHTPSKNFTNLTKWQEKLLSHDGGNIGSSLTACSSYSPCEVSCNYHFIKSSEFYGVSLECIAHHKAHQGKRTPKKHLVVVARRGQGANYTAKSLDNSVQHYTHACRRILGYDRTRRLIWKKILEVEKAALEECAEQRKAIGALP